ncbi:cytochrome c oxidase subunit 3 [Rickettsiales bacterium]|nr:cytochrome c oxidase subunit 3 [Rickettsiales bacterium]
MSIENIKSYKKHDFHLVDPSPWPLFASGSVFMAVIGGVWSMHQEANGQWFLISGIVFTILTAYFWWRDVVKEGRVDKAHTENVKSGLRLGMALFILSEIMFFFAFFFSFFHVSIFPVDILDGVWPIKEGVWPPESIKTLDPWDVPFLNTLILLLSGTTVTWAHYSLINNNKEELVLALGLTVLLGFIFSGFQVYEYIHALHHNFNFTDSVYGANFYMATGFHGFHVLIGTIFLLVCYFRARKSHFSPESHLGFEFAAWYWHFVDVVWLFLFSVVYIWGA